MYGLVGRELRSRVNHRPSARAAEQVVVPTEGGKRQAGTNTAASTAVTTPAPAGADLQQDDSKLLHSQIASYDKNSGWLWLTMKASQTPAWKIDVELDPRSAPILDSQNSLQLFLLWETMAKEKTYENAETLHDSLKAVRVHGGEKVNVFRTRFNRFLHSYEHGAGKKLTDQEQAHILKGIFKGSPWEEHMGALYKYRAPNPKAPTTDSLFELLNNLEREKKLVTGGKQQNTEVRRRHQDGHDKVPARAFMATGTPSPVPRGKPVSAVRTNKYASKPALSTGAYCTPTAPRAQSNPPPAGLVCHNCNKPRHKSKDCTMPAATCGHCGNKWHMDMHCRKLKSERTQKSRDIGSKYTKPPSAHLASCPIPSYMGGTFDSDEDSAGDFVAMEYTGASAYPAAVNLGAFYESDTSELDSSNQSLGPYTFESDAVDFDESVTTESVPSQTQALCPVPRFVPAIQS
jgi:hypothetical protein